MHETATTATFLVALADAPRIHDAGTDLLMVRPALVLPPVPDASTLPLERIDAVIERSGPTSRIATAIAPLGLSSPELATWIDAALALFGDITGSEMIKLRVEITDEVTCPQFHVDMVHVRLVTTLHGAGTEFVHRDEPLQIRQARAGDLVLLKGRRHPTRTDAVKHRSPQRPRGERRIVMVLDS